MSAPAWLPAVGAALRAAGLDLVHPCSTRSWAGEAPELPSERLALVVGNTRALWPALERALGPLPAREAHPIDAHVERSVATALAGTPLLALHLAHAAPHFPVQRFAARAGLAHLGPAHLLVHREHGPWFALRAVAVFDVPAAAADPPAPDPCAACARPCLPALGRALAATAERERAGLPAAAAARAVWPLWLAVRDACPEGRGARYPEPMLRYHHAGEGWPGPGA